MRVANNTEWLFFHLWKKDLETGLCCPNIYIAETILYRWAQPFFWYYTSKEGTIVRKTKEKVLLPHVEESFLNNVSKCGVVTTCINSNEDSNLKSQEKVEFDYLDQTSFHDFLFQKEKPLNLILQKFVEPKNGKNALIKVSWTPQFCIFFRKTNNHDINNTKIPLLNRLTTFEGPLHFATSDSVSTPILAAELEDTCLGIVKHIQNVTGGNIQISKMVLYFKLDEKNRLWLLFCTGLKFKDKSSPTTRGSTKKKTNRAISPVLTLVSRKDDRATKHVIPQEYLVEDQLNEPNPDLCLKCNTERLLYDLKMKLLLDYEEKILHEEYDEEENHRNTFNGNPYRISARLEKKHSKRCIVPEVIKKLYPNLAGEKYLRLKDNMSFLNMIVKLCENCYLKTTDNLLENIEEQKIKNVQVKIREKLIQKENRLGLHSFVKEMHVTSPRNASVPRNPTSNREETLTFRSNQISNNDSERIEKMTANFTEKISEIDQNRPTKVSLFSSQGATQFKSSAPNTERKPKAVVLPHIEIPHFKRDSSPQVVSAHQPNSRLSDGMNEAIAKEKYQMTSPKDAMSPYAYDVSLRSSVVQTTRPIIKTVTLLRKKPVMNKNGTFENEKTYDEKIWSQTTKNATRTTYSSMLNTIKDLKHYLGEMKIEGEEKGCY